jgi:CYTH domain-containing protein
MKPAAGLIDARTAAALGFDNLSYVGVERERRWLCAGLPALDAARSVRISDLYVSDTSLRLREYAPLAGPPRWKLSRKVDLDASRRLMTTIYLSSSEYALFTGLPGRRIVKTRHRTEAINGVEMAIDSFEGDLQGLFIAEAEFSDDVAMAAFPRPDFAMCEVTGDARYSCGALARHGIPIGSEVDQ